MLFLATLRFSKHFPCYRKLYIPFAKNHKYEQSLEPFLASVDVTLISKTTTDTQLLFWLMFQKSKIIFWQNVTFVPVLYTVHFVPLSYTRKKANPAKTGGAKLKGLRLMAKSASYRNEEVRKWATIKLLRKCTEKENLKRLQPMQA